MYNDEEQALRTRNSHAWYFNHHMPDYATVESAVDSLRKLVEIEEGMTGKTQKALRERLSHAENFLNSMGYWRYVTSREQLWSVERVKKEKKALEKSTGKTTKTTKTRRL